MKTAILIILAVAVMSVPVFAETVQVQDRHLFHKHINEIVVHDKFVQEEDDKKFQQGVGIDLVTYENKTFELGTEVRHNLETSVTTAFSVIKIKKPLLSFLFKKK